MKSFTALSIVLSLAATGASAAPPAAAQEQETPEPVLPPAASDFVSTTIAGIKDTPLFYVAYMRFMDTMGRYISMRQSGDCTPQIARDLKDAKAMADAARVNEWNGFTRLQKDFADYARAHSNGRDHFKDRIKTPDDQSDINAAQRFITFDRDYPTQLVSYSVFSQADSLYCNKDGTSKMAPSPPSP